MNKSIAFILLLGFLYVGCLKDTGNYAYVQAETITVSGIADSYTKLSEVDSIILDPTVSSNKAGNFEYLWGIYETSVQGYAPVLDTICKTKDIHYQVDLPAKGWVLVFRVTNTTTGYSQYFTSSINVITRYTRGWYVAKTDGTKTDMDLFLTPTSIVPESKAENVYSLTNGKQLDGKPLLLNYYTDYKSDILAPGMFVNTKALFILTDKDASVVNINTLSEIHDLNGIFYSAPSVKKPQFVTSGSADLFFCNNGQLSSLYSMSANTGQFGVEKLMDDQATPYHLSKYFIASHFLDPVLFDEVSSSFVTATGTGTIMTAYSDAGTTDMSAKNTNKTCLYMSANSDYPLSGIAVLKDKSNPSLMIISQITPSAPNFQAINDTVSATAKIQGATRFALNLDEDILYFVVGGNQVWSYNLANDYEQLQYTVPVGEEITLLRHREYTEGTAYSYNYVIVATKSGGNYKVRMFTKSSGNLAASPSVTLEGTGEVGDVMYMSPSVSNYTYVNTY